ncbi:phosphopantetheine-binding protein [Catellatospora sp. NPDC049133]|uniref:phosphopantetheine-binding protein n=1 Tax=Catellatospora sp. NPDC049133 TaxID=3155499 RepID=UPI0033E17290
MTTPIDHQMDDAVHDIRADRLCAIFADVLGVATVGVDDDFFDLGGQSLQAMLIAARIKSELGAVVTLIDLFDHPTVGRLLTKLGPSS